MRSGKQYLDALDDGRTVYLGGTEIKTVASHPAFRRSAETVAGLYDAASTGFGGRIDLPNDGNGREFNPAWLRPQTDSDLELRRATHSEWADRTFGLFGRSPDHVSSFITGMACEPSVSGRNEYANNIMNYWNYARDNDLYIAYGIVPPGGEKGRDAVAAATGKKGYADTTAALRMVRETDSGVIVRGTKTLATGAPIADELLLGNVLPLNPGEEEFAITFTIPVGTRGIKIVSRKSFSEHAVSAVDDPLAYKFDETDAIVYFDDVLVPWERVFSYRNLDAGRALFYETPAHALGNTQAHIRLLVKMRLMLGLLNAMTKNIGTADIPPVKDRVAGIVVRVAMLEAMLEAQHAKPHAWPSGFLSADLQAMYATMVWTAEYYSVEFVHEIRELMGSHIFQQPADISAFENAETRDLLMRAMHVNHTLDEAKYRYKLLKVLWDLVGTEFAGRHIQYEDLYAGPKPVTRGRAYAFFRWSNVDKLAQRCLEDISFP